MMRSTRRRQLEQSQRSWTVPPHGPFGPVEIHATTAAGLVRAGVSTFRTTKANYRPELNHSDRMEPPSLSMPAFFEYLHDHPASTDLAKALAEVVMLRTSGARGVALPSAREKVAS